MNKIIIFDYETNTLPSKPECQPIQYCFRIVAEDSVTTYTGLVKCESYMSEEAYKVHGISYDKTQDDGISVKEFTELVNDIFTDNYNVIIGHNIIKFDIPITEKYTDKLNKRRVFDTAGAFKCDKLGLKREPNELMYDYHKRGLNVMRRGLYFNLAHCLDTLGIKPAKGAAHDALVDVLNTERLFYKLAEENENLVKIINTLKR